MSKEGILKFTASCLVFFIYLWMIRFVVYSPVSCLNGKSILHCMYAGGNLLELLVVLHCLEIIAHTPRCKRIHFAIHNAVISVVHVVTLCYTLRKIQS